MNIIFKKFKYFKSDFYSHDKWKINSLNIQYFNNNRLLSYS